MSELNIAIIAHAYEGSKEASIAKTCALIERAAKGGAQLVCLSELHQGAYFCQRQNVDNFDLAKDFNSDCQFWGSVAKKHAIVLVTSLFERRSAGLYFNTAVVFEKDGSIAGKYRKMHIPDDPNFYEKFYFTPGDLGFGPIKTSLGTLGVLVCWDQWYPEAARIMALKGAEILIYPTAIGWFDGDSSDEKARQLDAWMAVQRGHAVANGLPVVAINRIGFESARLSDKNALCAENEGIRFWGHSFVYGPQGEKLFESDENSEVCEVIKLDKGRCENVRRWWPFLRDRRIDSYKKILKRFC